MPGRQKVYLPTGELRQNFLASMPIHRYDVSHGLRSRADFQSVLDLWYIVNFTPYEGFRFKDWRDFLLTTTNSRLVLISGSNYQIYRVHTFGGIEFLRPIYKPVANTVTIQRNRSGGAQHGDCRGHDHERPSRHHGPRRGRYLYMLGWRVRHPRHLHR